MTSCSPTRWAARPGWHRVYDYWLGGEDNFAADRAVAEQVLAVMPEIPTRQAAPISAFCDPASSDPPTSGTDSSRTGSRPFMRASRDAAVTLAPLG